MAALIGALRVTLGANTAQYEAGMRRAQNTARRTGRDISTSMQSAQRSSTAAFRAIGLAVAGFGVGSAVGGMTRLIDAAKNMEAQLRLATRQSGTFAQALGDVRRIATETRTGLEETAQLYSTIQRTSRELGVEQNVVARATETVAKSFQISGASAAEAAGATRQFLQAIQSGTLRGEEFNSVLEQAPRLATLTAQALGVQQRALRGLAEQGRITSQDLVRALSDRRFTEGLDAEFRELPRTFEQAMTLVRNAAITFFGGFERGGRFSEALFGFGEQNAQTFEEIDRLAEETGRTIRDIFTGLANVFDPMADGAANVFEFIRNEARGLQSAIADILGSIDWLSTTVDVRTGETSNLGLADRFLAGQPGILDAAVNMASRFARNNTSGSGPPLPAFTPSSRRSGGRGGRGGSAEARARRAEAERERALRDEEQFYSQMRQFRIDMLRAQQDQTTSAVSRLELDNQILDIEREEYQASVALQVATGDLTQARADQLLAAYDALDVEQRQTIELDQRREVDAQSREIDEARYDVASEALRQELDLADTAAGRRDVENRLLDLAYRHERARLQAVLADETASQAAVEEARLRLAALDQWRAREQQMLNIRTQGPLESFLDRLPTSAARANEALEMVAANGLQSIEDGLVAALTGTKSLADAFRDMAASIIADLIRIQIQQMIMVPLTNMLGGAFGGGGKAGAAASALGSIAGMFNGGGRARGGPVVPGRFYDVGEDGPERLFMGPRGGFVVPMNDNEGRRGGQVISIGPIHVSGAMSDRDARRTGHQIAAAARDSIARSAKSGY